MNDSQIFQSPVTLITEPTGKVFEVRYFQPHYEPDTDRYIPYGNSLQKAVRFQSPVEAELVLLWLNALGIFQGGSYPTYGVNAQGKIIDVNDRVVQDHEQSGDGK